MPDLQTTQSHAAPGVIDFGLGHPADSLLPLAMMRDAAALRLGGGDSTLLQYGLEQGDGYFRLALADMLNRRYGATVSMNDLFISNGASQALDLLCTLYTQPGDIVFVEEPSYFLALRIFADHHLHVVSIPTDEHGLRMDALEDELRRRHPVLLYTIPTHQNPAGFTMPLARRQRLVELSQAHSFLVIADEVYHLLSYDMAPPPPLATLAASGSVIGLGSFSKILAPGLRLGWVQSSQPHIQRLVQSGLTDSGGGLNPFTSGLVRMAIEQGWQEEYLAQLHATYRNRIDTLDHALRSTFGATLTYNKPTGGYFFWLRLPNGMDGQTLLAAAQMQQVGFRPGVRFSSHGALTDHIRLSFAYYDAGQLIEGVERLKAAFDAIS